MLYAGVGEALRDLITQLLQSSDNFVKIHFFESLAGVDNHLITLPEQPKRGQRELTAEAKCHIMSFFKRSHARLLNLDLALREFKPARGGFDLNRTWPFRRLNKIERICLPEKERSPKISKIIQYIVDKDLDMLIIASRGP